MPTAAVGGQGRQLCLPEASGLKGAACGNLGDTQQREERGEIHGS